MSDYINPYKKEIFRLIPHWLEIMSLDEKIKAINELREFIHEISPFNDEPVDMVYWVKNDIVEANDYNPNSVAPPEMELLERSIDADGYTQPIVSWSRDGVVEVVDGFHRH
jgi:ParB-like chromosome segregation protein Spo0J